jgi:hypothetical protein
MRTGANAVLASRAALGRAPAAQGGRRGCPIGALPFFRFLEITFRQHLLRQGGIGYGTREKARCGAETHEVGIVGLRR